MKRLLRHALLPLLAVLLAAPVHAEDVVAKASPAEQVEYAALLLNGKKIGYGKTTQTISDTDVTTIQVMDMTLSRAGTAITIRQEATFVETPDGKPKAFRSVRKMGIADNMQTQEASGVITEDGKLELTLLIGGREVKRRRDWPEGALMPYGLEQLAKAKGFDPGTTYEAKVFDTDTFQALTSTTKVGEVEQIDIFETKRTVAKTTQILATPVGQMSMTTYVDPETHKPVLAVIPMMGMTLKMFACDKTFALSEVEQVGDLLTTLAIQLPAAIDPRSKTLTYIIEQEGQGVRIDFARTDTQTWKIEDNTFVVTATARNFPEGGMLPYAGDDADAKHYLKPSNYVQSDDPAIKALAVQAVGDAKTPAEAARNIETFVSEYISEKSFGVAYASASEVAKSREGDCSEHAVLTAALCRAAGIPAQVVTGVVYADRWGEMENVMLPHAWNQVYVDGKWVPLDAAFIAKRAPGADRIALTVGSGDMADFFGMVNTLGNFRVVEAKAGD